MIRYDKNLNAELARTVRNFNAKLARLEAKGIETKLEKVSIKTIRREYQNRQDLISYIREMRKFGQRGVERIAFFDRYKTPVTEYELQIAKIRQSRALRMAEEKIEEARRTIRTTGGKEELESLMGTDYENRLEANLKVLKETKFSRKLDQAKQARIVRAEKAIFETEARSGRVRDNFFEILNIECEFCGVPFAYLRISEVLKKLNASQWELARNGEELIVALIENYPRIKEVTNRNLNAGYVKEEKIEAVRNDIRNLIEALSDSVEAIYKTYSEK